jgi:putative ABC transport system ATP-binding protein
MTFDRIVATGVVKRFRGARSGGALPPFDLALTRGEMVAITGPTASGKTTLVNLLAGWDRPDAGTVTWEGAATAPPRWPELTVIPQGFALVDELNVIENVMLAARARTQVDEHDVDEVFDALGLGRLRERSVEEISVGERQRVMVARALAGRPAVIFADEPVAHQDQRNADAILRLLAARVADGAACLVATREAEIAALASRRIDLAR